MGSSTQNTPSLQRALAEIALASGGLALGISEFSPMTTLPAIAKGIGAPLQTAAHIISAYAIGVVIGAPLIAVMFARVPRRALLIALAILLAASNALSALCNTFPQLMVARFVAGVPHGAYFGVAALIAASLAPVHKRGQAIGRVMLGLTVSNIFGVPLATWLCEQLGWRAGFLLVSIIATCSLIGCRLFVPQVDEQNSTPRGELRVFRRLQVWLTLAVIAVGFGGLFAVYTYVTPILITVARVSPETVPVLVGLLGVGLTVGSIIGGWFADRSRNATIFAVLGCNAIVLPTFSVTATNLWAAAGCLLAMGAGAAALPAVQTKLMDVAGDAQTVSAALLHSAFNLANALGAWAGGAVITRGMGVSATGWVGAGFAACGAAILALSTRYDRRLARNHAQSRDRLPQEKRARIGVQPVTDPQEPVCIQYIEK